MMSAVAGKADHVVQNQVRKRSHGGMLRQETRRVRIKDTQLQLQKSLAAISRKKAEILP
jgi:hypothetical protein